MSYQMFIQHFLNAVTLGSLYALIAIGYSMVYGILRLINFAHGEIFMLGPISFGNYPSHLLVGGCPYRNCGYSPAVFGGQVRHRPLRDAPRISALISAIGVSFFLQNFAIVVFSAIPRPVYRPGWLVTPILIQGVHFLPLTLVVPFISFVLMLVVLYIVYKTKPGLAMRAISKDIETSRLMGVSVDQIVAITFMIGSALAAASGIMWSLRYPQVHPMMGMIPGFKAFIAAVVGGIGSIQGAVIGGMLLGFIEIMIVAFFPNLSGFKDAFAFVLLIFLLLLRPTGIMGERLEEKV